MHDTTQLSMMISVENGCMRLLLCVQLQLLPCTSRFESVFELELPVIFSCGLASMVEGVIGKWCSGMPG